MSITNFSIQGTSINATLYQGKSRQFNFLVDEPPALQGNDLAANPVEYLLAGYAGCLNVVFNLVAKELEIAISGLKINIDGDLDAAKFLGLSNEGRAGFQSLNVYIEFSSNTSQKQIDKLVDAVKQRCPINDNLSNNTPIFYQVKKSSLKEEVHA